MSTSPESAQCGFEVGAENGRVPEIARKSVQGSLAGTVDAAVLIDALDQAKAERVAAVLSEIE